MLQIPTPSIPEDDAACAQIVDLDDGVACSQVRKHADNGPGACLYTAAVDATLDITGGTGVNLMSTNNDVHITAASQVLLTALDGKLVMQGGHAVEISSAAGGVDLSSATAMNIRSGGAATLTAGEAVAIASEGSSCLDFHGVEVGSCTDVNLASIEADPESQRLWMPQVECMATEGNTWVASYLDHAACEDAGTCIDSGSAITAATESDCANASGTWYAHRWLGGLLQAADAMTLASTSSSVTVTGEDGVTVESTFGPVELKATGSSGAVEITGQSSVEVRAMTAGVDIVAGGDAAGTGPRVRRQSH